MNNYIKVFSNCIPVKGSFRGVIMDTQRKDFFIVPNSLINLLELFNTNEITTILSKHSANEQMIINEYIEFLISNELAFYTSEVESFPPLSLDYHEPKKITNAIIDYSRKSTFKITDAINQIDNTGCEALQIRFFDSTYIKLLSELIQALEDSKRLRTVELIIKYSYRNKILKDQTIKLISSCLLISRIVFHTAPLRVERYFENKNTLNVSFTNNQINSATHCGFVSPEYFNPEISAVLESMVFNNCLNGKISIDENGEIKNCPALTKGFGNIHNKKIESIIDEDSHSEFMELWKINKDRVLVCKDCEFRYLCSDCRAILNEPENPYSKPKHCSYDPYIGQWKNKSDLQRDSASTKSY